jgi:hypothetical protein
MDDLRKVEKELKELHQLMLNSSSYAAQALQAKVEQLEFNQETTVMNVLEKTDRQYDLLVQENFDLLINDRIEFNVIQEINSENGHAIKLDCSTDHEGLFHARATEVYKPLINFCPLTFVGLVNYLGEADLFLDQKKIAWYNRCPKKFKGTINAKGGIYLEAIGEPVQQPKKFATHFVGDLFSDDRLKKEKFLKNRSAIKAMIGDFRKAMYP